MMAKLKKWAKRFLLGVALLSVLLVWFLRGDGIDRAEWCGEHVKTVQGVDYRVKECLMRAYEPFSPMRLRVYSADNQLLVTRRYSLYGWWADEQDIKILDDRVVYVDAVQEDEGIPVLREKEILLPPPWQDRLKTWLLWTVLRW
jgi:hypothetical protein